MTNGGFNGFPSPSVQSSQALAAVAPFLPFPRNTSGNWYGPTVVSTANANASTGTLNRVEWCPILLSAGTLDRIGVNHFASATASEVARLGLYASVAGDPSTPGSLVVDGGTVDLSTATAAKSVTISAVVATGVYWLAVCRQGPTNTATLVTFPIPSVGMQSPVVAPSTDTTFYNSSRTIHIQTGVTAALPAVAVPTRGSAVSTVYAVAVRYV